MKFIEKDLDPIFKAIIFENVWIDGNMAIKEDAKGFNLSTGEGFKNQLMFMELSTDFRTIIVNLNEPIESTFSCNADFISWT